MWLLRHTIGMYRNLLLLTDSVRLPSSSSKFVRYLLVSLFLIRRLHLIGIYPIRRVMSRLIWRLRLFLWGYIIWHLFFIRFVSWRLSVNSWMLKLAISSIASKIELTLSNFLTMFLPWWTRWSSDGFRSLMIVFISLIRARVKNRRLISGKRSVCICNISLLLETM